ncbi:MAG: alginate export family protein [Opitutaceae bacterium]|nr:alginate export family protein [Opitutaceae bacterium]
MLRRAFGGLIVSLAAAGLSAAEPAQKPTVPAAAPAAPASEGAFVDALKSGKLSLNLRARWENADQSNLEPSDAVTLRTRLGYTTGAFHGFKLSAEFEDISALDADSYNQSGLNPGGAGKTVIADPETTEVNQVWLGTTLDKTDVKVGRQRLVLDNQRFVGDVAWRQNMQTFDAVGITDKTVDKLTLNYAYLWQINRVFGHEHPQGTWDSDSHLINASTTGIPGGTLAGYIYLLDFENSAANSCATYGISFAGTREMGEDFNLAYRAEYATQSDYGSSTFSYRNDYLLGEFGAGTDMVTGLLGYEVLGTDNNVGFKTPLATLHAFNGWADVFLNTPNAGLEDLYLKANATLPRGWTVTALYHQFETDLGDDLGDEWDLLVSWKINKQFTTLAKAASFNSDSTLPDVTKFWVQVDFVF